MAETCLYLVPTPIGNLEDITLRSLRVLKEVDCILAEDTRTTGHLLKHYQIQKPLQSFHAHNEHFAVEKIISRLKAGEKLALVSDAGTPGISDPGFLIARACMQEQIKIECLPGATAFVPALVKSGLPCDQFVFVGFLPVKKGRKTELETLALEERTMIFYESPHRIVKTLEQFCETFGKDRMASLSRELTKMFEETITDTLEHLFDHYTQHPPKGEIVLVVDGQKLKKTKKQYSHIQDDEE
ncbi:MAG TPA: 16S rRNA (cytidine(1402)-2'-O)-methyltransferase [Cytophagales bacterium]|nr:16S rRNA (cytidine(1402)-2'-O)-methyltransferase [Cytophagales bacterium]